MTQWAALLLVIGHGAALAIIMLLGVALLSSLVARFEIYQAQLLTNVFGTLPEKIEGIRSAHAEEIDQYFKHMENAGVCEFPVPTELDRTRIQRDFLRLMPPDFKTGWRKPVWWPMVKIAFLLTGHGPKREDFTNEQFDLALSAYRVGSAYFLLILYQTILVMAGLVGLVALGFHK